MQDNSSSDAIHDHTPARENLHQRIVELEQQLAACEHELMQTRARETLFQTVADFTYDWEYWRAPDGRFLYVSPSCERITGYSSAHFQSDPALLLRIVHPDDRSAVLQHIEVVSHHQSTYEVQFRIMTRHGDERWIGHMCQPVYDAHGHWSGQRASNRDITEQVRMEEAYHVLVNQSFQALVIFQDGRMVFANPGAARITGYSVDELLAMSPEAASACIHPDDRALVVQRGRNRQMGHDVPPNYTFRIIRKDGTLRWLDVFSTQITYQGKPAVLMTYVDITERKHAEEALRASEARYRALVQNFPDGVVLLFDQDMRYQVAGGRGLAVLGMTPAMIEGKTLWQATPPEVAAIGEPLYRAVLAGEAPEEVEQRYGERIYRTQPVTLRNEQNEITGGMIISQDITEYKRAAEALRISREQYARAVRAGKVGVWDWNLATNDIYLSPMLKSLLGYEDHEIRNHLDDWGQYVHAADQAAVMAAAEACLRGETAAYEVEHRMWHKDGTVRWIIARGDVERDAHGNPIRMVGTDTDITERRRMEEDLRTSQQFIQRITNTAPYILYVFDLTKSYNTYVNSYGLAFFGVTLEEMQHARQTFFQERIYPDDFLRLAEFNAQWVDAQDEQVFTKEYRMANGRGEWRWLRSYEVIFQRGEDGQPIQIMGTAIDITEQKHTAQALHESQTRLQALFDNAAVGMGLNDIHGRWFQMNRRGLEMLGYSLEEITSMTCMDITYPDDQSPSLTHFYALLRGDQRTYHCEKRYVRKDATLLWVNVAITAVLDADDQVEMFIGVFADITERKDAEEALRVSEEKYRVLIEHARVSIASYDYDGRILVLNQTAAQAFGGMPADFVGQTLHDCFPAEHADIHLATIRHVIDTGISEEHEENIFAADGERWYWTTIWPIPAAEQQPATVQAIVYDITARKQLELQLQQANAYLHEQAIRDPLTSLFNRRYLDETLKRELQRALRQGYPVGIVMFDIDHFKRFNDTYGHDAGDMLLRRLGGFLHSHMRQDDIVCRYGGEEFTLVLPGASLAQTAQRAEEIRMGIQTLVLQYRGCVLKSVTVSLGVAIFPEDGGTDEAIMKAADNALYCAKTEGRNRVCMAHAAIRRAPQ